MRQTGQDPEASSEPGRSLPDTRRRLSLTNGVPKGVSKYWTASPALPETRHPMQPLVGRDWTDAKRRPGTPRFVVPSSMLSWRCPTHGALLRRDHRTKPNEKQAHTAPGAGPHVEEREHAFVPWRAFFTRSGSLVSVRHLDP